MANLGFNPELTGASLILSNGNKTVSNGSSVWGSTYAIQTIDASQIGYMEWVVDTVGSYLMMGMAPDTDRVSTYIASAGNGIAFAVYYHTGATTLRIGGTDYDMNISSLSDGDVVGIEFQYNGLILKVYHNGTLTDTIDLVTTYSVPQYVGPAYLGSSPYGLGGSQATIRTSASEFSYSVPVGATAWDELSGIVDLEIPVTSIALTGNTPIVMGDILSIPVSSAVLNIQSSSPFIVSEEVVSPNKQDITIVGMTPGLDLSIPVSKSNISITGYTPKFIHQYTLEIAKESISIVGRTPVIGVSALFIHVPKADISLNSYVSSLGYDFTTSKDNLSLTGHAPITLEVDNNVTIISKEQLSLQGYAPIIRSTLIVSAGRLNISTYAPKLTGATFKLLVGKAQLNVQGYVPKLSENIQISAQQFNLTGGTPLYESISVEVPRAQINIQAHIPTYGFNIPIGKTVLSVAGNTVTLRYSNPVEKAQLNVNGYASSLNTSIPIGAASLAITGNDLIINTGILINSDQITVYGGISILQDKLFTYSAGISLTGGIPGIRRLDKVVPRSFQININGSPVSYTSVIPTHAESINLTGNRVAKLNTKVHPQSDILELTGKAPIIGASTIPFEIIYVQLDITSNTSAVLDITKSMTREVSITSQINIEADL